MNGSLGDPTTSESPRSDTRDVVDIASRHRRRALGRAQAVVAGPRQLLVVPPHPDDETLTVGGLIQQVLSAGGSAQVVAVTDGGSAYPTTYSYDELARIRRDEQAAALVRLGVPSDRITRLGLRDGEVRDDEQQLCNVLARAATPDTTLVAPWSGDVHPDHEAVGRAAARAARTVGCELWSSLFWAWHQPATDLDRHDLVAIELSESELARKYEALMCHHSQLTHDDRHPILTAETLAPARWRREVFVRQAGSVDR